MFRFAWGEQAEPEQNQLQEKLPECLLGWGLKISQQTEQCWKQERNLLSTTPGLLPPALAEPRETCSAVISIPLSRDAQQCCSSATLWLDTALAALGLLEILSLQAEAVDSFSSHHRHSGDEFSAVLTSRTSSGNSSLSSSLSDFSRALMEISSSFSWCRFSRSRHCVIVQKMVKEKAEHTVHF